MQRTPKKSNSTRKNNKVAKTVSPTESDLQLFSEPWQQISTQQTVSSQHEEVIKNQQRQTYIHHDDVLSLAEENTSNTIAGTDKYFDIKHIEAKPIVVKGLLTQKKPLRLVKRGKEGGNRQLTVSAQTSLETKQLALILDITAKEYVEAALEHYKNYLFDLS